MGGSDPVPAETPSWWRGYFTQRRIGDSELPKVMRRHIVTGAMGSIYGYLLTGLMFVYFGTLVGMKPYHWGLLSGISQWVVTAQPVAARLTQRLGRRKRFWVSSTLTSRMLRYAALLGAYLLWRAGRAEAVPVLIAGAAAANLFGSAAEPPWLSWLADIIPEKEHGAFWGRRAAWIAGATVVVLVAASLVADLAPAPRKPEVVFAIFTFAWILGVVDVVLHGSIPEPPMHASADRDMVRQVAQPLRDRRFRPWLVFICCWTFSMTLGGALSDVYAVENLGIKRNFLGGSLALTGVMLAGSVLTGRWSGRLVDGLGIRRVLLVGHLGWGTLPLFWIAATPGTAIGWLAGSNLVGGTFATAANTAANKLVTRLPPPSARTMYIAVSSTLASAMGGLGSMVAAGLLRACGDAPLSLGGLRIQPFILLFLVSAVLRIGSAALMVPRIARDVGRR
jgi:MFS family permease